MDESTGVNPGASTGAEVSSTPSGDTATATEATSTAPSVPAEQTATQSESVAAGDAAGEVPEWLISEEEANQAPDQWREKLTSLLSGYKSLESDHKALKTEREAWQSLERYGDPDAITNRITELDGLGAYATDENGQIIRDDYGFPYMSTAPFLEGLQKRENGQNLTDQLAYDIWQMQRPDGQTYGSWYLRQLGLDPARIDQYANAQPQVTGNELTTDEIKVVDEVFNNRAYTEALKTLTRSEQDTILNLLNDFKDADAEAILKREAGRLADAQRLQQVENYQKQQEQQEVQSFWNGVRDTYQKHVDQSNRDAIAALTKQIGSQVTFSADPTTNAIQTNAIGGMIAALCYEPTRFAMEPVLEALGMKIDPQIDGMLQQWDTAVQDYLSLKAAADNPRFAQYRNDQRMNEAKSIADGMQQRVLAKLAPIGAKLAKVLAGQNQELRDQKNMNLAAAQNGRPTLGSNGVASVNGKQIPQGVDPFTIDFLRSIS